MKYIMSWFSWYFQCILYTVFGITPMCVHARCKVISYILLHVHVLSVFAWICQLSKSLLSQQMYMYLYMYCTWNAQSVLYMYMYIVVWSQLTSKVLLLYMSRLGIFVGAWPEITWKWVGLGESFHHRYSIPCKCHSDYTAVGVPNWFWSQSHTWILCRKTLKVYTPVNIVNVLGCVSTLHINWTGESVLWVSAEV